ncbi:hypothetical protein [Pedococcus bigeumensis]|uniref:Interferon-induced transmembrane protein n=1 Tax=Pedococcus bigeumensis TaxID=433644 RepID=A0A502CME4_9MICO|nr:hypothetical protein [Pedococcus bigeumensis]TPG14068.1 hypothetical protein EAH86_17875 [Pedococcus bigeumensis]
MSDYGTPPPPPPPVQGYPGAMGGGEHPKAQTTLILSIVGLLCCGPLAIYTLITANTILREGHAQGLNVSKANTAKIISIIALALWAVGFIANIALGGVGLLSSN